MKELLNQLDKKALFERRWQMVSTKATGPKKRLQSKEAQKSLEVLWKHCLKDGIFQPKAVWGIFRANWEKPCLTILPPDEQKMIVFEFSEKLADRFFKGRSGSMVGLQAVTLGSNIKKEFVRLKRQKKIREQFLLYGLSAELTEALAKWAQERTQKAMGLAGSKRLSPGYPVWPALSEQKKVFQLLKPQRIGIRLSATWQMDPEFSTSAIVIK